MAEHVILFTGPMGAGKTTAIQALSEIEVVTTEAHNTDRVTADKDTTTVALDYGEITLGGEDKVRLYGIPGQRRFDFMWPILKERARGMVLLVNNDTDDPLGTTLRFLADFDELYDRGGIVIGVSRSDVAPSPTVAQYSAAVTAAHPDRVIPIFTVDPRDARQMSTLLLSLVLNLEVRDSMQISGSGAW